MNAIAWIELASPAIVVAGAVMAAVVKMTRLVDAVERLDSSMARIVGKVDDHEVRLNRGGL